MEETEEIISKFHLDLNMMKIKLNAYKSCLENEICESKIAATDE